MNCSGIVKGLTVLVFVLYVNCAFGAKDKYAHYQQLLSIENDSIKASQLIDYASLVSDSLNDHNFALLIFEKINSILNRKDYPFLKLNLYYNWALTYYLKGSYQDANRLYEKALALKIANTHPELKAKILNLAGANLQDLMIYKRALMCYSEALELYIRSDDNNGKATVYSNMANLFVLRGDFAQSNKFFNEAKKIFLKNNMPDKYATMMGNMAYLKWKLGKPDSAKILLLNSLSLNPGNTKSGSHLIHRIFNLGIIYSELKQWDSSFYYLNKGKRISDSLGLSESIDGTYYFNCGYCSVMKGDNKNAIRYYKLALASRTGIVSIRHLYENISNLYLKMRDYDNAMLYKNKSLAIADSIYQSELKEQLAFENKKIELIEKDYQNQIKAAEREQFLSNLKKRNYLLISVILVLIALVFLFVLYLRQYKLKVKKEHLQSELDFLKAQLNPHFLFNSINNIYVLLDENKEKASEILLKFSDLMRYQLYECNVGVIPLSKELNFLENFIEFEKLRYSNKIDVKYSFTTSQGSNYLIAPLLLQPFIENAFKHTPKNKSSPSSINVNLSLSGDDLLMEVTNTTDPKLFSELPGGVGLQNVKKRLKLLYSNKHELNINSLANSYCVFLKLKLAHD